jgi:hypothetical protein
MTKKDMIRQPMDLSLNSRGYINEGVTQQDIDEESRLQVQYKSEPQYELMVAAYNAVTSGTMPGGFKALQRVFRESNMNNEMDRVTKTIMEAIDIEDLQGVKDKVIEYAVRTGYAGGSNEVPMSELLDKTAQRQMRSVMGNDTDTESIVAAMQEKETALSDVEADNVEKKLDELQNIIDSGKKTRNLKFQKEEDDMTKSTRTVARRKNKNEAPARAASAAKARTPQARNKTSKEDVKARRIAQFSVKFQEVVNDIAGLAAAAEDIRLKVIDLSVLSVDQDTAGAAQNLAIMLNTIQEPLDTAYDTLLPEEDAEEDYEDYEDGEYEGEGEEEEEGDWED